MVRIRWSSSERQRAYRDRGGRGLDTVRRQSAFPTRPPNRRRRVEYGTGCHRRTSCRSRSMVRIPWSSSERQRAYRDRGGRGLDTVRRQGAFPTRPPNRRRRVEYGTDVTGVRHAAPGRWSEFGGRVASASERIETEAGEVSIRSGARAPSLLDHRIAVGGSSTGPDVTGVRRAAPGRWSEFRGRVANASERIETEAGEVSIRSGARAPSLLDH